MFYIFPGSYLSTAFDRDFNTFQMPLAYFRSADTQK